MKKRKFNPTKHKFWSLNDFPIELQNDWKSTREDETIIIQRIIEKLNEKSEWYKYYGEKKVDKLLIKKLKNY